jgi:hypothetical protein
MRHLNIPLPELENQSFDPEILDSLQNHPLELKLIQIIKENNRLTYFSDTDRFPNVESLEKTLQTWNISYERDFFEPNFMGNVIFFCNITHYIYRKANEVFGLSLCRNKLYEFKKNL